MRKTVTGLAATMSLALALTACGQSDNDGSDKNTGDKKGGTIGISMPTKTSERWINDGNNVVKLFKAKGYKTNLQYADDNVSNQVSQVENMVTKGVDLLVIAAIDNKSLGDVIAEAHDQGIPVIAYDRLLLETENVDYYASFDNFKVGVLQGQYLVDKLGLEKGEKGPFNIELFAGSADDNNTGYFFRGAMSVLKPYMDDGTLKVPSGQTKLNQITTLRWEGAAAQSRMENLLSKSYSNKKLDAVLSPYDGMSLGIISALQGIGYGTKDKPYPIVTGQDAEVTSVKSIIAGEQTQTVFKDTRELAKVTVQMSDALLTGGKPEVNDTKQYDNGVKVVPAYLLQPVSVDKTNYKEQLLDSGYIAESRLR